MLIPRVPSVLVENYAGARRGTEHLIHQHNHERIHFLGDSRKLYSIQNQIERIQTCPFAGKAPSAGLSQLLIRGVAIRRVSRLLEGKRPPTAFFCGNNLVSRGLIRSLRKLGVEAPRDVAIIGFDDLDLADMLVPSLTVIRQPVEQLGTIAAGVLFDRLRRRQPPSGQIRRPHHPESRTGRTILLRLQSRLTQRFARNHLVRAT